MAQKKKKEVKPKAKKPKTSKKVAASKPKVAADGTEVAKKPAAAKPKVSQLSRTCPGVTRNVATDLKALVINQAIGMQGGEALDEL